ncbi:MAG TPA: hypothetical protein VGQ83_32555 [Polyangia bacterium]|jgi:hypothetical protein
MTNESRRGAIASVETLARRMPLVVLACAALLVAGWWVLARGPYYPPPPPMYPAPYPYPPPPVYVYQPVPVVQPTVCGCVDCGCAPCMGCACGGPGGCICEMDACACGAGDCVAVPPLAVRDQAGGRPVRPTWRAPWESAAGGLGLAVPLLVLAFWRRRS